MNLNIIYLIVDNKTFSYEFHYKFDLLTDFLARMFMVEKGKGDINVLGSDRVKTSKILTVEVGFRIYL